MSHTELTTAVLRRRRGVTKASTTKLSTRLSELEAKVEDPATLSHAQKLLTKLESLDSEFKRQHLMVIDSIPEDDQLDDNLTKEQDELDEHDIIVDHDCVCMSVSLPVSVCMTGRCTVHFVSCSHRLPQHYHHPQA